MKVVEEGREAFGRKGRKEIRRSFCKYAQFTSLGTTGWSGDSLEKSERGIRDRPEK
jgi:hypothetical protein